MEHFKALLKNDHSSAITDHVENTGHNIGWDHFDILASGKTEPIYSGFATSIECQCQQRKAVISFISIGFYFISQTVSVRNVLNFYCRCFLCLGSRPHFYSINSFSYFNGYFNGYTLVPEEGWFGQPKYSTPSKNHPTVCRFLLLYILHLYVKPIRSLLIQRIPAGSSFRLRA